jgi:hypothetical protein
VPTTVDPYAGLATNIPTNTCFGFYPQVPFLFVSTWSGTKALSGNVKICGDLKLTGNVTVAPSGAVLVIDNGRLDLSGFTSQTRPAPASLSCSQAVQEEAISMSPRAVAPSIPPPRPRVPDPVSRSTRRPL